MTHTNPEPIQDTLKRIVEKIPRHPTTVCSVAAGLYMDWAATLKQLGQALFTPDDEEAKAAKEARLAYEKHIKTCKICKEA